MEPYQLVAISFVLGVISRFFIKHPVWAAALPVAAVTLYEVVTILVAPAASGGASMWPIAAFFIVMFSIAGAALGVFLVHLFQNKNS